MQYKFSELIDMKKLESLINKFCSMTGISCFISEVGSGEYSSSLIDKNLYKELYGFNPLMESEFQEALKNILKKIKLRKKYAFYRCKSGIIYIGIPILVNNVYDATIFIGQAFLKEPDINCIRQEGYIDIVKHVPIITKEKIKSVLNFMLNLVNLIGEVANMHLTKLETNKKLDCSYIELNNVYKQLSTSQQQLSASQQKLREKYDELERVAYYDSLTNLPNGNFIEMKFNSYINEDKLKKRGVILIDLDNFKNINDAFGREFGDELLQKFVSKLQLLLSNDCIISRIGGDEFLIIKKEVSDRQELIEIIEDILNSINKMWILEDKEFFISSNIGAAIYPEDGNDYTKIFRNADIAMNKAKHIGKNFYAFFEKSMYDEILRKTELEKELRGAIRNNELIVYYQPQVDTITGRIVSLEALLRWNNKKLGWVSPLEFIKLAEETGLIVHIGEWVLKNVCLQHSMWKKEGYSYDFIAVNVSVIQLQNSDFLNSVKKILMETGTHSEFLEFEITESVMMQTLESNLKVLNELKQIGIRIALDDFGTGYSSLNYLKCLPINTLKLDKSFIDGLCKGSYEDLITHEMIKLAHKMNLDVIAEGVEQKEQLASLKKKRCNKIQGYYFSKPCSSEKIEELLKKKNFDVNLTMA